jgi:hypothetical protein
MEGPCQAETADASPDGTRELTLDMLAAAQLEAFCGYVVRCGSFEDVATCKSVLGANLSSSLGNIEAAVNAGKVLYHPDRALACIARYDTLACDRGQLFGVSSMGLDCALTFTGSSVDGQECAIAEECTSQECSIPSCSMACCPGTCVGSAAPAMKQVLEACTARDVCANSYCAASGVCEPLLGQGATCQLSSQCTAGYACKLTGTSQTCQQYAPTNGPCGSTSECGVLGDVCSNGMCTTGGLVGFACAATDGCQFQHQCASSVCALPPVLTESCANYPICTTGYCDSVTLTCLALEPNGSPCAPVRGGVECQSNYCDSNTDPASPKCATAPVCF